MDFRYYAGHSDRGHGYYPDILSLLANDWGTACPLPWHLLKDIPPGDLDGHVTNKDFVTPTNWMPVSGPFIWDVIDTGTQVIMKRNPDYYGYGLGWGPYNVDTLIFEWVKSPASRLAKYINGDIDFGEYSPAPVATFKTLNDTVTYPNLRVFQYLYPASNPIWLNFNNEYLSNRYVRMAIAHAIDYDYIINNLLDEWGIETAIRGKTPILPGVSKPQSAERLQYCHSTITMTASRQCNCSTQLFRPINTIPSKHKRTWTCGKVLRQAIFLIRMDL
jgi:ABC-type transport system substrate-binding protein